MNPVSLQQSNLAATGGLEPFCGSLTSYCRVREGRDIHANTGGTEASDYTVERPPHVHEVRVRGILLYSEDRSFTSVYLG